MASSQTSRLAHVPKELLEDRLLNDSISHLLPATYNFEIHKTIHHLRHFQSKRVALQMPEGLTMFATAIADIISLYTDAEPIIMGDVTYGACCIDDYTARALGCDFLVHYAHSCLVPLEQTGGIRTLYVFVEISIDVEHLARSIRYNFPSDANAFQELIRRTEPGASSASGPKVDVVLEEAPGSNLQASASQRRTHLALVGTVQFINVLAPLKEVLEQELDINSSLLTTGLHGEGRKQITWSGSQDREDDDDLEQSLGSKYDKGAYKLTIPQIRPLSPGEILGCTSPSLESGAIQDEESIDAILYLGDGRFHLESAMIANPHIRAYFRFDPYSRKFEREGYDHTRMRMGRAKAVAEARRSLDRNMESSVTRKNPNSPGRNEAWGLVLGTLGRQGSVKVLSHLRTLLQQNARSASHPHVPILLSELSPAKLALFNPAAQDTVARRTNLAAFVQTSCPRLSIDWGEAFERPLLSPYEAALALGAPNTLRKSPADGTQNALADWEITTIQTKTSQMTGEGRYPMDFYADNSLGPWTPRHGMGVRQRKTEEGTSGKAGGAAAVLKELRKKRAAKQVQALVA
ncbi:Diphthamide biosynthesis protein 1 [Tilletia horrida]|nr:Diphthamide biosynthesis protein 1 [Tilletia horrida]